MTTPGNKRNDLPAVSVTYDSRGSLLIYGPMRRIRSLAGSIPRVFKPLIVANDTDDISIPGGIRAECIQAEVVQLRGHLGRFRAGIAGAQGLLDLGPLSPNRDGLFDLVLDMGDDPLIDHEVPPLGYVHSTGDAEAIHRALQRLERLVGPVNKPRYFSFDERLCAHDHQGHHGCRRCLTSCPAGAISSVDRTITIDPYLCRGCGSCALVCPTGAVRYARPGPHTTLQSIAEVIASAITDGNERPVLVFVADEGAKARIPPHAITLPVPTVGSVGPELWLAALALGASRVVVAASGLLPTITARLLTEQVDQTRALLKGIGDAEGRLRATDPAREIDWQGLARPWPAVAAETLLGLRSKRTLQLTALSHLARHTQTGQRSVSMPEKATFGTLDLQQKSCTLCHACVGACPTGALRNKHGALRFAERDCVQCGLCVQTCPEKALQLVPRFDPVITLAIADSLLKPASEMFRCVSCGTEFAPVSLVEGSMRHVRDHPMFQGDGAKLLQMCMTCRQKATVGMVQTDGRACSQSERVS